LIEHAGIAADILLNLASGQMGINVKTLFNVIAKPLDQPPVQQGRERSPTSNTHI
jgi:hypothetical protein